MNTNELLSVANGGNLAPKKEGPAKFIREIDEYLGQTFDMMTQLDQTFGKFSNYFFEHANQVVGERDYNTLSKNEQTLADMYTAAALAVEGVNAIIQGIQETYALEKVKRLHRKVAETRYESLGRMIDRTQRCHDDAAGVLARHNRQPFLVREVKATFEQTADMLETGLCQYRDVRFRLDMLLWLKDEYEAWLEDRLYSDTPMPTMGEASIAAIYVLNRTPIPYGKEKREADLKQFAQNLFNTMRMAGMPNGKDSISSFEFLASIDSQLGAVLEHAYLDKDPLASAREEAEEDDEENFDADKLTCKRLYSDMYANSGDDTLVESMLQANPVTGDSVSSVNAFIEMKDAYDKGTKRTDGNGILLAIAVLFPIWMLNLSWYWRLALSVLALFFVVWPFFRRSYRRMTSNLFDKFEKMSYSYEHYMAQQAGLITPKSKVKAMAKSRNYFWGGVIVGGLIGFVIFPPVGAIVGAIFGAIIAKMVSDDTNDTPGENWQEIKICSPAKQWRLFAILVALIGLEVYWIFF